MSPGERLEDMITTSKKLIKETKRTIAASHDVVAASHAAREEASVLCEQAPGEIKEEPMSDDGQQRDIALCQHCGAGVHQHDAPAITVEADGAYRLWTPERAASFQQDGGPYAHVPVQRYLCPSCMQGLFPEAAGSGETEE